jgi:gliding motility-associated lipoprotein GldD
MSRMRIILLCALFLIAVGWYGVFSESPRFVPKPRGYLRIELPEKVYRDYEAVCPFTIPVPQYAEVELFKDRMTADSCWFNLYFPKYKARLHCTYLSAHGRLDALVRDAYEFAAKHEMMASGMKRTMLEDSTRDVYGIIYDIEGEAACNLQFFLTDSTEHFLRASLYFSNAPNPDSIAPVLEYLRADIFHLTASLHWRESSEQVK